MPWVSVLPCQGFLHQEGSPTCTQTSLRASGTGAATALLVAFSAHPVSSLAQGGDGMEEDT